MRAIRAFGDLQIADELVDGYGSLQLTEEAEGRIISENLLCRHGTDLDDTTQRLGLT